jgi:hypothetical protein
LTVNLNNVGSEVNKFPVDTVNGAARAGSLGGVENSTQIYAKRRNGEQNENAIAARASRLGRAFVVILIAAQRNVRRQKARASARFLGLTFRGDREICDAAKCRLASLPSEHFRRISRAEKHKIRQLAFPRGRREADQSGEREDLL